MPNSTVKKMQASFHNSFSMLERYIDVCPDDIWQKTCGGWPVWQQLYHAVGALYFFVAEADEALPEHPLERDICCLARVSELSRLSKSEVKNMSEQAKHRVNAYFSSLKDSDLPLRHEGSSRRMKADITHAETAAMVASHTMYHLGSCDAALRNHGLKGVF